MTDYTKLSGPQLVAAFNAMVAEMDAQGQNTVRNVTRFPSLEAGRRRCEELAKQLASLSKPEKKKETSKSAATGIAAEFGFRSGSKQAVLLTALEEKKGAMVPVSNLIAKVYGANAGSKSALVMVVRGLNSTIKRNHLGYEVKSGKSEYGLFKK